MPARLFQRPYLALLSPDRFYEFGSGTVYLSASRLSVWWLHRSSVITAWHTLLISFYSLSRDHECGRIYLQLSRVGTSRRTLTYIRWICEISASDCTRFYSGSDARGGGTCRAAPLGLLLAISRARSRERGREERKIPEKPE